jgi:hypothetical protein
MCGEGVLLQNTEPPGPQGRGRRAGQHESDGWPWSCSGSSPLSHHCHTPFPAPCSHAASCQVPGPPVSLSGVWCCPSCRPPASSLLLLLPGCLLSTACYFYSQNFYCLVSPLPASLRRAFGEPSASLRFDSQPRGAGTDPLPSTHALSEAPYWGFASFG